MTDILTLSIMWGY